MPELKRGEAKFLQGCTQTFLEAFELTLLVRQLESRRAHPAHLPLIRRVLVDGRRHAAAAIEVPNEAKEAAKKGGKSAIGVCGSPDYTTIELLA